MGGDDVVEVTDNLDRAEDEHEPGGDFYMHREHRTLQESATVLRRRCANAATNLEGIHGGGASVRLLELAQECVVLNETLAAHLAKVSDTNAGLVEMLKKNQDGRAALKMRRAAGMLVKALANAEEEVQSLKVNLKHMQGQRDEYKGLLARNNAELRAADAYAQLSRAYGNAGATGAGANAAGTVDDDTTAQPPVKRRRKGDKGRSSPRRRGDDGHDASSGIPAGAGGSTRDGAGRGTGTPIDGNQGRHEAAASNAGRIERPGASLSKEIPARAAVTAAKTRSNDDDARSLVFSAEGAQHRLGHDRYGGDLVRELWGEDISATGAEGFHTSGLQPVRRDKVDTPSSLGEIEGRLEPAALEADDRDVVEVLDGEGDGPSAYDSDDAPSMFF